jgi:hypothetical protein
MLPLVIKPIPDHEGLSGMAPAALLMRLGVTTLRGSNPRSSATDLGVCKRSNFQLRSLITSALASPHKARTPLQPFAEPCVHLGNLLRGEQDRPPGERGPLLNMEYETMLRPVCVLLGDAEPVSAGCPCLLWACLLAHQDSYSLR